MKGRGVKAKVFAVSIIVILVAGLAFYLVKKDGGGDSQLEKTLTISISLPEGVENVSAGWYFLNTQMADNKTYSSIVASGLGKLNLVGEPVLPYFGKWITIPDGTEPTFEVTPGTTTIYENIDIPPAQLPPVDNDSNTEEFYKDENIYEADNDYPGMFAKLESTYIVRGTKSTIIQIYPFQYNPIQRRLKVYPDLTIEVNFLKSDNQ